jgi:hypothetical protein
MHLILCLITIIVLSPLILAQTAMMSNESMNNMMSTEGNAMNPNTAMTMAYTAGTVMSTTTLNMTTTTTTVTTTTMRSSAINIGSVGGVFIMINAVLSSFLAKSY